MALNPAPTGTITLTAVELAAAIGAKQAVADRLLPVVTALVLEYAPRAPDAILNEAATRTAGWLAEGGFGYIREGTAGPLSTTYGTSQKDALRHSGAMSLLSRWKRRRAGVIG